MTTINLLTRAGKVDLTFRSDGTDGYDDLARAAVILRTAGGVEVRVAALRDVIRSKEAAGRTKDAQALPELRRLAGLSRASDLSALSFPQPVTARPKKLSPQEQIDAARAAAALRRGTDPSPRRPGPSR